MSFNNLYYKRVGTAKACYVCRKPTTTVLATINAVDFLYACSTHLTDYGFATLVKDEAKVTSPAVTAEEIAKVKAEWEERQKKKLQAEKEKIKDNDKEAAKKDDTNKKEETKSPKPPASLSTSPGTQATPTATHERYILHRDFFSS
ncbi:hypothetical protein NLJ89_g4047 [Agrocybe chaxingu]|uniref:DUF1742-domain-containing protein n=1 Tax=Agrocybe chaxingu TaxID=84603 RepID=A0A9W8K2U9_9AGAR|nr:hypothetical protein NLJ89_g4047 [Agrocybe chaxingu]